MLTLEFATGSRKDRTQPHIILNPLEPQVVKANPLFEIGHPFPAAGRDRSSGQKGREIKNDFVGPAFIKQAAHQATARLHQETHNAVIGHEFTKDALDALPLVNKGSIRKGVGKDLGLARQSHFA